MDGRKNPTKYVDILRNELPLITSEVVGEVYGWIFQQDNAPIHTSHFTRKWLSEHSSRTLPWLARSELLLKICKSLPRRVHAVTDALGGTISINGLFMLVSYQISRIFINLGRFIK